VVAIGEGEVCRYRMGSFEVEPALVTAWLSFVVQIQRFIVMLMVVVG
jgi:hypothetical protein